MTSELTRLSDVEVFRRAVLNNDEVAWIYLVKKRLGPPVLGVCRAKCRDLLSNIELAEDAFQETFITLKEKAKDILNDPKYKRPGALVGWVCVTAEYKVKNLSRKTFTIHRHVKSFRNGLPDEPGGLMNDPVQEAERRELSYELQEQLHHLPEREQDAIRLRFIEQLGIREIAEHFGCPQVTIRSWITRGLGMMRANLEQKGYVCSAAVLATALAESAQPTPVPAALVERTVAALMQRAATTWGAATITPAPAPAEGGSSFLRSAFHKVVLGVLLLVLGVSGIIGVGVLASRVGSRSEPVRTERSPDGILAVAVSPDSRWVIYGGGGGHILVRRTDAFDHVTTLEGHTGTINHLAFNPRTSEIISGSSDGTVRIRKPDSLALPVTLPLPPSQAQADEDAVRGVAVDRDGEHVACVTESQVLVWNLNGSHPSLRCISRVGGRCLAFSPDGLFLACAGKDGQVRVWVKDSGWWKEYRRLGHRGPVSCLAWSPDGKEVVSGGADLPRQGQVQGQIKVWNLAAGRVVRSFSPFHGVVRGVQVSPNGRWLVAGGGEDSGRLGRVKVFDLRAEGDREWWAFDRNPGVTCLALSADGKRLFAATGLAAGTSELGVWDVATILR